MTQNNDKTVLLTDVTDLIDDVTAHLSRSDRNGMYTAKEMFDFLKEEITLKLGETNEAEGSG